jgi:hypothetical protein
MNCPPPALLLGQATGQATCTAGVCGIQCLDDTFHYCADNSCHKNNEDGACVHLSNTDNTSSPCDCAPCTQSGQANCCDFCEFMGAINWIESFDPVSGICEATLDSEPIAQYLVDQCD